MRQSINRIVHQVHFSRKESQLHFGIPFAKMSKIVIEVRLGNHRLKKLKVMLIVDEQERTGDREEGGMQSLTLHCDRVRISGLAC